MRNIEWGWHDRSEKIDVGEAWDCKLDGGKRGLSKPQIVLDGDVVGFPPVTVTPMGCRVVVVWKTQHQCQLAVQVDGQLTILLIANIQLS